MFLNYTFSWTTTTCQESATFCESMIFCINSWILWVMMASTSIMKYKTSCWITLIGDSVVVYEMIQFETRPYLLRSYLSPRTHEKFMKFRVWSWISHNWIFRTNNHCWRNCRKQVYNLDQRFQFNCNYMPIQINYFIDEFCLT